jgi:hypothetical protein
MPRAPPAGSVVTSLSRIIKALMIRVIGEKPVHDIAAQIFTEKNPLDFFSAENLWVLV